MLRKPIAGTLPHGGGECVSDTGLDRMEEVRWNAGLTVGFLDGLDSLADFFDGAAVVVFPKVQE